MRGVLNLTALITFLNRGENTAEPLDLAEFFEDRSFDRALGRFNSGRASKHVHGVLKDSRFLEENGLTMRGETNPFLTRRGERFVRAVGVTRVRRVDVSEDQFRRGAREIIFELRRNQ